MLGNVHDINVANPDSGQDATTRDRVRHLLEIRKLAIQGDELATERQHAKGKLTARQRLEHLLDDGSFTELDLFRRRASGSTAIRPHRRRCGYGSRPESYAVLIASTLLRAFSLVTMVVR